MKYAVAVQNTETLELTLMGPFDDMDHAQMIRSSFVAEIDAKYGILDAYSVWIVPLRSLSTEINFFTALFGLYDRADRDRTLESTELDL